MCVSVFCIEIWKCGCGWRSDCVVLVLLDFLRGGDLMMFFEFGYERVGVFCFIFGGVFFIMDSFCCNFVGEEDY